MVKITCLLEPEKRSRMRELDRSHVNELKNRMRAQYEPLLPFLCNVVVDATADKDAIVGQVKKSEFRLEVIGGNHSRKAVMELAEEEEGREEFRTVPVKLYKNLDQLQKLRLGYLHNNLHDTARPMSFVDYLLLFRGQLSHVGEEGNIRLKWKRRLCQMLGYIKVEELYKKNRRHISLAESHEDVWNLVITIIEKAHETKNLWSGKKAIIKRDFPSTYFMPMEGLDEDVKVRLLTRLATGQVNYAGFKAECVAKKGKNTTTKTKATNPMMLKLQKDLNEATLKIDDLKNELKKKNEEKNEMADRLRLAKETIKNLESASENTGRHQVELESDDDDLPSMPKRNRERKTANKTPALDNDDSALHSVPFVNTGAIRENHEVKEGQVKPASSQILIQAVVHRQKEQNYGAVHKPQARTHNNINNDPDVIEIEQQTVKQVNDQLPRCDNSPVAPKSRKRKRRDLISVVQSLPLGKAAVHSSQKAEQDTMELSAKKSSRKNSDTQRQKTKTHSGQCNEQMVEQDIGIIEFDSQVYLGLRLGISQIAYCKKSFGTITGKNFGVSKSGESFVINRKDVWGFDKDLLIATFLWNVQGDTIKPPTRVEDDVLESMQDYLAE